MFRFEIMFRKDFVKSLVWLTVLVLVTTLSVGNIRVTYATTNASDFTNNGAAANTSVLRYDTNLLVLDITLPMTSNDTLIDADGVFGVTFNNTVITPTATDGNAIIAFDSADNVYWCDADDDDTYDAGELIWLSRGSEDTDYDPVTDGDQGILGTAVSAIVTAANCNGLDGGDDEVIELNSLAASGLIHFHDDNSNGTWDNLEDLVVDVNDNNFYNSAGDTIIDGDGVSSVTDVTAGSSAGTAGTSALTDFVAGDNIYWYDAAGNDTWDAGADLIWVSKGSEDGDFDPAGDGDIAIAGTNTAATIADDSKTNELIAGGPSSGVMAYFDETVGGGFSLGTDDIFEESTTLGRIYNGDQLTAITLQNTGTAVQDASAIQDISAVKVWLDEGDGSFDAATDTSLGTATRLTDSTWQLSSLTQTISATSKRIFISVDILSSATHDRTFIFRIPILADANTGGAYDSGDTGVFLASTNDGPADAAITNANTQTIFIPDPPAATEPVAPAIPATVWTSQATDNSLRINWSGVANADNYTVYRRADIDNVDTEIIVASNYANSFYTNTGLNSGTTYYYAIRANSSSGLSSDKSAFVSGVTTGAVALPDDEPVTDPTVDDDSTPTVDTPTDDTTSEVGSDIIPTIMPNPALFDYRASWVSQSGVVNDTNTAHVITATAGETITLELTLKNIGSAWWYFESPDNAHEVKIGTWNEADRISLFQANNWLSSNRVSMLDTMVPTGETVTFSFNLTIPTDTAPGTYSEYFRLVAEYVEWFGPEGVFWEIEVS